MNSTDSQIDIQPDNRAWVVGIDGSDAAAHALEWATIQAPGRTSRLRLVTSWQAPVSAPTIQSIPSGSSVFDQDQLASSAQRVVDAAADNITPADGITLEPVVAHGGPSAVLLDAADDAALLIVGTRGRGGFQRLLIGSTSTQCATHASGAVAVVPQAADTRAATDIVVGIDGSDNSIAALEWALTFAQPGSRVEALSVWDTSPITVGTDQYFFPEATDLAEQRFDHLVDRVVADHPNTSRGENATNVTVEHHFVAGMPRRVLSERSRSTDLLVLGARGHGAIGAALMGSVSTWTLHHANTTTVIVPARTP
jgi:nucleotide-binding universal stress UspA family protein